MRAFLFWIVFTSVTFAYSFPRRSAQECMSLGFVTSELICDTCEVLKEGLSMDVKTEGNMLYSECLSCCTKDRLGGDATRVVGETAGVGSDVPYVLPLPTTYWKARCEISVMAFEQSQDWNKLLHRLKHLYPLGEGESGMKPEGGARHPPSLVEVYPVYQRQSFVNLYAEGQALPIGSPDNLINKGSEPAMFLEISTWDANKLEQFLNHSIAGSSYRKETILADTKKTVLGDEL